MKQFKLIKYYRIILIYLIVNFIVGCSSFTSNKVSVNQQQVNKKSTKVISTQLFFVSYDNKIQTATFSTNNALDELREYHHSSTQVLRDAAPQQSVYRELPEQAKIRTGNLAFDALFALAINEMQLNSVSSIRDDAYNNGKPILCDCFETGEKWHYVWTRDISYAANLSLAMLAPVRVKNSLEFKLSKYRQGIKKSPHAAGTTKGLQIIQDTGSGGSWPVSTDRVTWAFGAQSVLANLSGKQKLEFANKARIALNNTIENDRLAAFNSQTGLYTGEQSFLDWREQSYATWIANDLASMSSAHALSTNVGHYQALKLAEELSRKQGDLTLAIKYKKWHKQLKNAINKYLWLDDVGMYSSLTAGHLDNSPMYKFDWLGQSLAIITGIADDKKRQKILASYPHSSMGAPVIFPQQLGVPIYHNRAIWPFVSAYGLKAAKLGKNTAVANAAFNTLIRGAALNISNMENFEWLTAEPFWQDNNLSGPVINSKRQLWSVAAYLSMVINDVFGLKITNDGLFFHPFITTTLRKKYFAKQEKLQLTNINWLGKTINIDIHFPQSSEQLGYYPIDHILVNGKRVNGVINSNMLAKVNTIEIYLAKAEKGENNITLIKANINERDENVFSPYEPKLNVQRKSEKNLIKIIAPRDQGEVYYQIYRNGKLIADKVNSKFWFDNTPSKVQNCYSATAIFLSSNNQSHHSQVVCTQPAINILVNDPTIKTNVSIKVTNNSAVIENWGKSSDSFYLTMVNISNAGRYAIQFNYSNNSNSINTGITNGVKWLQVLDKKGKIITEGAVQFPHTKNENPVLRQYFSTPLIVNLPLGYYRLKLIDHYNMSYLAQNKSYLAQGGVNGVSNQFNLYSVRLLPLAQGDFYKK
jgi:hypothetical protein